MLKGIAGRTLIYTLGGMLPAVAGFVLIVPLTKYLSPDNYALQALYISFSLLLQIVINYGLDQYLVRNYILATTDAERERFVSIVYSNVLKIGLIALVFFSLFGGSSFSAFFQRGEMGFLPFGVLSVLTALFNAVFRVYTSLMIYKEAPQRYLQVNILNTFMMLVFVYAGLYVFPESLWGPVGGRFAAGLFTAVFVLYHSHKKERFRLINITPKEIHRYGFPVMLFGLLTWGMSYGNNYIINYCFTDLSALSVFDIVLKFVLIVEMFQNGMSSAMSPKFFSLWKEGARKDEELRLHQLFNALTIIGISLSIAALPLLSSFLIKQKFFLDALIFFPLLVMGHSLRQTYNFFINPIYFREKTARLPLVLSVSFLLHVLIAIVLIQTFGLIGIFLSLSISRLLQVIILMLLNRDMPLSRTEWIHVFIAPLLYMLIGYSLYWLLGYGSIYLITQFTVALILVVLFYYAPLRTILRNALHAKK